MEGMMTSVWSYQESIDELKHRLLYTNFELESVRIGANEVMRNNEENVKQLLHLLNVAWQERDEARDQLQSLLNKVMPTSPSNICTLLPHLQHESPHVKPMKANSSITESDSLSETYNHHSYGSPPVDSFFDAASSPCLSNIHMADSSYMGFPRQPTLREYNGHISLGNLPISEGIISPRTTKIDHDSAVIDNLVKGKPLPQKGKLLQAVMEAGPLLQMLLVAGPLPRWRNPPPLQPHQIPPVSIEGCDSETINPKQATNPNYPGQGPLSSSPYLEIFHGSSEAYQPTSMLSFTNGPASCINNGSLLSVDVNRDFVHNQIPTGKQQRFL